MAKENLINTVNDDCLIEKYVEHIKDFRNQYGNCYVPEGFVCANGFKLSQTEGYLRNRAKFLNAEQKKKLKAVKFEWKVKNEHTFQNFIEHFMKYKQEFGNAYIPVSYVCDDGYKLGKGVANYRSRYESLNENLRDQLNAVGFVWKASNKASFEKFISHLKEYKNQHGDCLVPVNYICDDNYKLGQAIVELRGGVRKVDSVQTAQLNKMGFVWSRGVDFDKFVKHLLEYKKEFGNCNVNQFYVCDDGYKLGQMVTAVRRAHTKINEEQWNILNEMEFVWDALEFDWQTKYEKCKKFLDEKGRFPRFVDVSKSEEAKCEYMLAHWLSNQRKLYQADKSKYPADRFEKLKKLGVNLDLYNHRQGREI